MIAFCFALLCSGLYALSLSQQRQYDTITRQDQAFSQLFGEKITPAKRLSFISFGYCLILCASLLLVASFDLALGAVLLAALFTPAAAIITLAISYNLYRLLLISIVATLLSAALFILLPP